MRPCARCLGREFPTFAGRDGKYYCEHCQVRVFGRLEHTAAVAPRVEHSGAALARVEPAVVAAALGAEPKKTRKCSACKHTFHGTKPCPQCDADAPCSRTKAKRQTPQESFASFTRDPANVAKAIAEANAILNPAMGQEPRRDEEPKPAREPEAPGLKPGASQGESDRRHTIPPPFPRHSPEWSALEAGERAEVHGGDFPTPAEINAAFGLPKGGAPCQTSTIAPTAATPAPAVAQTSSPAPTPAATTTPTPSTPTPGTPATSSTPKTKTTGTTSRFGVSEAGDYDAIPALNWSSLKHLATSPKMYRYRIDHPEPDRPAFHFGRAFHCALIEHDEFLLRFAVEPDFGDCRNTRNKADRDKWRAANAAAGREVVSGDDMDALLGMAESVRAHKVASALLKGTASEQTITWTDPETGLACKARVDLLGSNYLVDIKSTADPAPRRFTRSIAEYLTHGQLAFYFDGALTSGALPRDAVYPYVIAVEKTAPWDVAVYRTHLFALEGGRRLYHSLLRRFVECEAANWWPGCAPGLMQLDIPEWAAGMAPEPNPDPNWRTT